MDKTVLVFGERYFHYTSSLAAALRKLGYTVLEYYYDSFKRDKLSIIEYIKYKFNKTKYVDEFYKKQKQDLFKFLRNNKINRFISNNGNWYYNIIDEEILIYLRQQEIETSIVYVDAIAGCETVEQNLTVYDKIFVFESSDVEFIYSKYNKKAIYLPIGINEDIFCSNIDCKRKYDIGFLGNATYNRLPILEAVAKYCFFKGRSMCVVGKYWNNSNIVKNIISGMIFKLKYPYLYRYVKNGFLYEKQVAKFYSENKINLNIHTNIHKSINPRTFEIMGNPNFEICDYRDDAARLGFISGKNIVMYDNYEDLLSKIDFYINNGHEREKIAQNGCRLIKERFLYWQLLEPYFK